MTNLWSNSIELMILGMGTVFVFLVLLIFGVTLMSKVLSNFATPEVPMAKPIQAAGANQAEIAAVAAAAWAASENA